ncbi:MAG: hypothetical protein EOP47_19405 [Sphingobacteriaceae bacterium]|nr:MAG: hypothetical protein EOP47_19405 [Sphingobacteriaceae bacterium]
MKKATLLFVFLIYSAISIGQTYSTDNVVVTLPNTAFKVPRRKASAIDKTYNKHMLDIIAPKSAYQIDNLVLGFYALKKRAAGIDLQQRMRQIDTLNRWFGDLGTYHAAIRQINGHQALVENMVMNGHGTYRFYYLNKAGTAGLPGKIEYNEADSVKAKTVFNELLNGIKFTDER